MGQQKTDWGEILWLDEGKEILHVQGMQAGVVTLFAGAHQPKHIHYEEQVIYVIQGTAVSRIDGQESILKPGGFFHWKAGIEHEIINVGAIPFRHLLISNPGTGESDMLFQQQIQDVDASPDLIYIAVEAIRTQFLESLHYGYSIFDSLGNVILQSPYYPEYCVACCNPGSNPGGCFCMRQMNPKEWGRESVFQCRYGMEIFHYPIYFGRVLLGYIQGGYVRHSKGTAGAASSSVQADIDAERIERVYDVPESVVAGIKALLQRIVKAIRNFCEFEQFRRELLEKELCIASHEETQRILMKNLRDTQYAMTDLKINNHFLFNTLNSMASMALDGGLMPLYQSIVDLSKMFHYTLRTQNAIVPLEKELDYVRAYLQLQKLRYGEDLELIYRIDQAVLRASVPFNFLQPIVENAFVHGFKDSVRKKLKIEVAGKRDQIEIKVINSGAVLSPQVCYSINQGILSNTSHGLSMIYQKLVAVYEKTCAFELSSLNNGMTCFRIQIPYVEDDIGRRLL